MALYTVNRLWLRNLFPDSFFTRHLNDFLLLPIFAPLLVAALKLARVRGRSGPPAGIEVLAPLIVVAFTFEVLHPRSSFFRTFSTGDPRDVFWYVAGGIVACAGWHFAWTREETETAENASQSRGRTETPAKEARTRLGSKRSSIG